MADCPFDNPLDRLAWDLIRDRNLHLKKSPTKEDLQVLQRAVMLMGGDQQKLMRALWATPTACSKLLKWTEKQGVVLPEMKPRKGVFRLEEPSSSRRKRKGRFFRPS